MPFGTLTLDGQGGSDTYVVRTAGSTGANRNYTVNALDTGTPGDGVDQIAVYGATADDVFLLRAINAIAGQGGTNEATNRPGFVAVLHATIAQAQMSPAPSTSVERVNYDTAANARLAVYGLEGNDSFFSDDVRVITTLDGGAGNDSFQIGQIYGTKRDTNAGIQANDTFTPIATTRGWLSAGTSAPMVVQGGAGDDQFTVYSNQGVLRLEGDDGDDLFTIRAFALAQTCTGAANETLPAGTTCADGIVWRDRVNLVAYPALTSGFSTAAQTDVRTGTGANQVTYNINAPVSIDGGNGFDKVVILGTEFADHFVITDKAVYGAGLQVQYANVEALEIDGLEGDDTFDVLSTPPGLLTRVIGGLAPTSSTWPATSSATSSARTSRARAARSTTRSARATPPTTASWSVASTSTSPARRRARSSSPSRAATRPWARAGWVTATRSASPSSPPPTSGSRSPRPARRRRRAAPILRVAAATGCGDSIYVSSDPPGFFRSVTYGGTTYLVPSARSCCTSRRRIGRRGRPSTSSRPTTCAPKAIARSRSARRCSARIRVRQRQGPQRRCPRPGQRPAGHRRQPDRRRRRHRQLHRGPRGQRHDADGRHLQADAGQRARGPGHRPDRRQRRPRPHQRHRRGPGDRARRNDRGPLASRFHDRQLADGLRDHRLRDRRLRGPGSAQHGAHAHGARQRLRRTPQALYVRVLDDETPGVVVTPSNGSTLVSAVTGTTDDYTLRLTKAPAAGTTVAVRIITDGQTDVVWTTAALC